MGTALRDQPVQQRQQVVGPGREGPLFLLDPPARGRAQQAGLHLPLMDVQTAAARMDHTDRLVGFHCSSSDSPAGWSLHTILMRVLPARGPQTEVPSTTQV